MTIHVLRIDGQIRGLFTDESECYRIVDDYEKCGGWDIRVDHIEANQFYEEPIL